ncbi:MAG: hypothetical protein KIT74_02865 [Fimbriimonadales bacterium]|nr:hypothetical protein [Fimbriimonadales bacterium]
MPKSVRIMVLFGLFLIVCGLGAWAVEEFSAKARTAVIAGGGGGALMLVMAFLSSSKSKAAYMTGIHLGMVLALLLGAMYGWRAIAAWEAVSAGEPKAALAVLLTAMAASGVIAFIAILRNRPAPENRT